MILRDREIVCKKAPCPRNDRGEKDQYIEFALSDKGSVTTFEILGNGSNGLSAELKERANSVLCVKFESDKSGNWNQFRRIVNQVTQVRRASVR